MKFKSLFLGMLSAAVLVSCNNDVIDNGSVEQGEVVEGLPIYATMSLNAGPTGAGTYSGADKVEASTRETQVSDVAMYIYKSDASGFVPQCAVYLPALTGAGLSGTVTMRTTSGKKKIFVAANPKTNPTSTSMVDTDGFGTASKEMALTFKLNDTLYSTSATAFAKGNFATPAKTKADGLIVNFAMGSIYGGGVAGDAAYAGGTNMRALMTNWDGPIDHLDGGAGADSFDGNASFTLSPDIDSVSSMNGTSIAQNHIQINIQRQYAKVSFKFGSVNKTTVAVTTPANLSTDAYVAAAGQSQEGRFIPWGSGATYRWSLGNIPTAQVPFQQFDKEDGATIRDVFYLATDDSLSNSNHFAKWTQRYDNTRVFPSSMNSYPSNALTVTDVKTTMLNGANSTTMTPTGASVPGGSSSTYNYAYTTENARQHPVLKDHQTYAIVGGFYQPKTVTTQLIRKAIASNGLEQTITADNFSWTPSSTMNPQTDTLYYVAADRVFISGRKTLQAYYAWVKKVNVNAGGEPGGVINSETSSITYDASVEAAIQADIAAKDLIMYFQGQCWYRVYLVNDGAKDPKDKALVARNHIYDVTITAIKGPGIGNPNDIIIPGEPVLELDTYVDATIVPLPWHRVTQGVEVDNK